MIAYVWPLRQSTTSDVAQGREGGQRESCLTRDRDAAWAKHLYSSRTSKTHRLDHFEWLLAAPSPFSSDLGLEH